MSSIERFSELVASKISFKLSLEDKDKEEVLAYGAFVLFQTTIIIMMVTIFGILFNVLLEVLVISFTASILRKSSGGAHATSPMNCAHISVIIFGGLALLEKHFIINIGFSYSAIGVVIAFIITYYIIYKYCPVETVTKPLRNENTRKRLKKISLKIIVSLSVISLFMMVLFILTKQIQLLTVVVCISLGVLWQSITLVSLGHIIIDALDKVLSGTNRLIRRENK